MSEEATVTHIDPRDQVIAELAGNVAILAAAVEKLCMAVTHCKHADSAAMDLAGDALELLEGRN